MRQKKTAKRQQRVAQRQKVEAKKPCLLQNIQKSNYLYFDFHQNHLNRCLLSTLDLVNRHMHCENDTRNFGSLGTYYRLYEWLTISVAVAPSAMTQDFIVV